MPTLASRKIIDANYPNIRPVQEDFDNFISMPHFQVLTLEIKGCKSTAEKIEDCKFKETSSPQGWVTRFNNIFTHPFIFSLCAAHHSIAGKLENIQR